jgi:subtilisin family serine protease
MTTATSWTIQSLFISARLIVDNLTAPTVSFGVAGGYFYDWGLWFDVYAKFYPGWDLAGNYLSIFYDYDGHGTACSSVAAGRRKATYNLGYLGPQRLIDIAPGAKVLGVKGLWWGIVEPGMMWAAGFDVNHDGQWYWTEQKRAHVISNSWGISLIYIRLRDLRLRL